MDRCLAGATCDNRLALGRAPQPENFDAFRATWVEGRSAQQVASEHGLPTAQVYVAKSRGLKLLREKLLEIADEIPTTNPRGFGRQDDDA